MSEVGREYDYVESVSSANSIDTDEGIPIRRLGQQVPQDQAVEDSDSEVLPNDNER